MNALYFKSANINHKEFLILGTSYLWMVMLMLLWLPGFAEVGLSLGHWPLSSLPNRFPCFCEEKFMMHVYATQKWDVDIEEKTNWHCISQRWEWL